MEDSFFSGPCDQENSHFSRNKEVHSFLQRSPPLIRTISEINAISSSGLLYCTVLHATGYSQNTDAPGSIPRIIFKNLWQFIHYIANNVAVQYLQSYHAGSVTSAVIAAEASADSLLSNLPATLNVFISNEGFVLNNTYFWRKTACQFLDGFSKQGGTKQIRTE
jgi:hypothetical protein